VRRGQFNDAPHAAGTKVIMHDHEFHATECFTSPAWRRTFFRFRRGRGLTDGFAG
jgi:hypothetical protein